VEVYAWKGKWGGDAVVLGRGWRWGGGKAGGGCRFVVEGGNGGRSLFLFCFLDSGVGGRITVEKRGSDRVVLEGLWDLCFRAI